MTQALDALDVRLSREATSPARGAPASTGTVSRFGTFAITFGIAFALYYTVFERLNWPFFTYHPVTGQTYLQLAATSQHEADIMVDVLRKKSFRAMAAEIEGCETLSRRAAPVTPSASAAAMK